MRRAMLKLAVFLLWALPAGEALAQRSPLVALQAEILQTRLLAIGLAALAGLLLGALFSPALRDFRRFALIGLIILGVIYVGTSFDPLADFVSWWVALAAFFVAFGLGIRLGVVRRRHSTAPRPTSFGSAQWATEAYLDRHNMLDGVGFLLGAFSGTRRSSELIYEGDRHLLTVAPTRSGKGVSSIIPNLLLYEGSVVVIDPKGENALITAHRRGAGSPERGIAGIKQNVYIVDPWGIAASKLDLPAARFNPLDWIRPEDPDLSENAFLLADAFIPTASGGGEGQFWDEEAKALLTGVMLYVATAPEEAEQRHLGRVRDILMLGGTPFESLLEKMYEHPNPIVSSTAMRTVGKDPKLRANVMASVQAHTHFLDSPRIRESLKASDFSFADLKTSAMTVYIVLPADRLKTFDRWLRLLVQQAISVNARNIGEKPKKPILFMLDEMAALGRLTMVEQAYGLMAGFGMQLWGIVQDLSQLQRIYGDGWETFIANSGVIQYFGSRDRMTAEYFSTLCGVTTIRIFNLSQALSETLGITTGSSSQSMSSSSTWSRSESSSSGTTQTVNANESQRKLAYPDELMVMHQNRQIIFVENLNPIPGEKIRWFEEPDIARHGVNLHASPATASPMEPEPDTDRGFSSRTVRPEEKSTLEQAGIATARMIRLVKSRFRR